MSGYAGSDTAYPDLAPQTPPGDLPPDPGDYLGVGPRFREILPRIITVVSPGAGLDWSTRVPNGVVWVPQVVKMRLLTSAVVANRQVRLAFSDGTTTWLQVPAQTAVTASSTGDISFGPGLTASAAAFGTIDGPLPIYPFTIPGGTTISSVTGNIDVGDQYSAISLYVYEIGDMPLSTDMIDSERGLDILHRMRF